MSALRLLAVAALLAALAPGMPLIRRGGVTNAASRLPANLPGGGIAPGSLFSIRGRDLAPAPSVLVLSQGSQWPARVISARAGEIRALMPLNVPSGFGSVVVSVGGQLSAPSLVRISPTAFGIFTSNGEGTGPVRHDPARPGDKVVITGTGLGAAGSPNIAGVEFFLGGKPARVLSAGPDPASSGIDRIEFQVPPDVPHGCHVPLQARVAGWIPSNVATLAIEPNYEECEQADRVSYYIRRGGRAGFVIPFRLRMRYDGEVRGKVEFAGDALAAGFRDAIAGEPATSVYLPPPGACTVLAGSAGLRDLPGEARNTILTHEVRLDAGTLHVGEGAAAVSVPPPPPEREVYYGVLGGILPDATGPERPLFLHPGMLSIASLGGRDVPPFSIRVQVPEPITWTNRAAIHTIDRGRDLTLRWDLRAPRQPVLVAGVVVDEPARIAAGFLCRASAAGRQFTIPAPILQSLPPSRTAPGQSRGFLFLATLPAQGEYFFQESGLDGLLSIAVSLDGRTVRYR
jgi:uncharacterized protein (TIGR03437 family)